MHSRPRRRTSKILVSTNTVFAWVTMNYALYTQQGAAVVASLAGIILAGFGIYTGVGHMDLRQFMVGSNADKS